MHVMLLHIWAHGLCRHYLDEIHHSMALCGLLCLSFSCYLSLNSLAVDVCACKVIYSKSQEGKIWPAGHIRPARDFHPAHSPLK